MDPPMQVPDLAAQSRVLALMADDLSARQRTSFGLFNNEIEGSLLDEEF